MTFGLPRESHGCRPRTPTAALFILCDEAASSRPDRQKPNLIMKANLRSQPGVSWLLKSSARINSTSRFTASLRVPASPQNWACLRDLRHAELEAWNKAHRSGTAPEYTSVAQGLIQINTHSHAETKVLLGISVVAAAAVAYALWDSTQLISHWSQFVKFVGQLLA